MATITVTVPTVTEYTVTPSRTSPTTFFADRETRLSEEATRIPEQNTQATALNTFKTQANAVRDEVNGFKTAAETAQGLAETAQAAAELAETGAAESATASSDSADASEVSRLAAEAILDNFDDRYLGAKASDPTLDNDGNALQSGALYYNTTSDEMKVYDLTLTTWISISYVPTTLTSLSDTNLSTPSNGQVLSYDFGTSKWVNTTPTSVTVNNTLTSTSVQQKHLVLTWERHYKIVNKTTLESGTNIKTVGGVSILGAGNIAITGAGSKDFIASGAIDDGKVVYLNADGTVTMVSGITESIGTPVVFESANSAEISATFDSFNNKVVIAYQRWMVILALVQQ
jgi:hypothetical protein